jgi:hypothetical protein
MSEKEITIIAPEGFEAVYDDSGTVTFRPITKTPGVEAFSVTHGAGPLRIAYEQYVGPGVAGVGQRWNDNGDQAHAPTLPEFYENPNRRNFRFRRTVSVTFTHPSEAWVNEGVEFLEDYIANYLVQHVVDAFPDPS